MSLLTKLPLDLYGTSTTNRVVGEEHTVTSIGTNIFSPNKGPFYSSPDKLTVYSVTLGRNLDPYNDYICLQFYQDLADKTGREVMCAIMIVNPDAYGLIRITYQAVGGPYQNLVDALIEVIDQLELDNRPVNWGDIIGLPDAFNPADHLHHIDDTYGWENVVDSIDNVTQAILVGSSATLMEVLASFETLHNQYMGALATLQNQLTGHEEATGNTHQLTKAQFGVDLVPNFPLADRATSEAASSNEHLMSPLQVSYLLDVHPTTVDLQEHLEATNPHNITKITVDLGNVQNYGVGTIADFNSGANNRYVVTSLLKTVSDNLTSYFDNELNQAFDDHLNAVNPHNITKATVLLSNVENYGVGTTADITNNVTNKYMTTNLGKWVMDQSIVNTSQTMASHLAASNPHNITKVTVQLGNVDNFATANTVQGAQGLSGTLFMTPASTNAAIQALAPIKTFQGRTSENAGLQSSDRPSLGLGENQAVRFASVEASTTLTGASTRRIRMLPGSTGTNGDRTARFMETIGTDIRNTYLPWPQRDDETYQRLLSTFYLKKPYAWAIQRELAGTVVSYPVDIYDYSVQEIKCTGGGTSTLTISASGNSLQPNTGRDKANTSLDDGRNEWLYGCVLSINPGNRTIQWNNINWGNNGAPELTPNKWHFIMITQQLIRNADGIHYYAGFRGFNLGGGF